MTIAGIEALGLAVPPFTLPLTALAAARGVEPAKFTEGLGLGSMAVAPPHEDTVTLAVRAARDALQGIDPNSIGLLIVGTETAVDHSKPVAAFVHGLLGLPSACRSFETKHACFGATAGLMNALDWIRAGSANGKKALIIASDIARYGLGSSGEPTQGAGAVALLISTENLLVAFEERISGSFTKDVADFWRPLDSKDALVDGQLSQTAYLQALEGAWRDYQAKAGRDVRTDDFAAMAYHVPYGKMAVKAHKHLRGLEGDADGRASYAEKVAPGLELPKQIGNVYTGSLYLALASTLLSHPADLTGQSLSLFSYGSGSCAELFVGRVAAGAQARVRAKPWSALLAAQTVLDVPAYEALFKARDAQDVARPRVGTPGPWFAGEDARYRRYVEG